MPQELQDLLVLRVILVQQDQRELQVLLELLLVLVLQDLLVPQVQVEQEQRDQLAQRQL